MSVWANVMADWHKPVAPLPQPARGRGRPPRAQVTEKACTRCEQVLPIASFYCRPDRPGSYWAQCKQCVIERQRIANAAKEKTKRKPRTKKPAHEYRATAKANLAAKQNAYRNEPIAAFAWPEDA